jgi:hypothetical protein
VEAIELDPETAVDFYGGLFGWEFETVMPAGREGKYFVASSQTRGWSLFDMSGEPFDFADAGRTAVFSEGAQGRAWSTTRAR